MILDIKQISMFHPILVDVLIDTEEQCGPLRLTSLWRESGIHGTLPLRAVDASCHSSDVGQAIAGYINSRWVYDPKRPKYKVCLYHGEVRHIHIQVHPNTRRI